MKQKLAAPCIDGALIDVGPGRSEAPVWRGAPEPGAFRALNFQTLNVTAALPPDPHVLALQAMFEGAGGAAALLQVVFRAADGAPLGVVGTDAGWAAFDGNAHRRPGPPAHGWSAGTAFLEYIDARAEPVGWAAARLHALARAGRPQTRRRFRPPTCGRSSRALSRRCRSSTSRLDCRFVRLDFSAPAPAFALSAWQVSYPWVETDSAFSSDNATLDAVYDLCRYTLHAVSLDTYTDSNTRERRVYEADGLIAETGRLLQRDVLFARHSHSYVFQHPTWPIEWFEMRPELVLVLTSPLL